MAEQLSVTRRFGIFPMLVLAASCATVPQATGPDPKLTAALVGQVAEKPRDCIPLDDARSGEVFRDVILYRTSRQLSYVNASPGCNVYSTDPIFVNEVRGSFLCRGDIVRLIDRSGGIPGPACVLGNFTPYRTPR